MLILLWLLGAASPATNDNLLYCKRVHARAWADAAPLVFPELLGEGFRYPTGTIDPALAGGVGSYQLRVGLSYSITDLYRGVKTMTTAAADCALQESRTQLDDVLPAAADIGKREALEKQSSYLDEQRVHWRNIEKVENERLLVRGITYLDFDELRKRVTQLERKSAQTHGELGRISAEQLPATLHPLAEISRTYAERSAVYERRADDARAVQAWQFRVTGGIVPLQLNETGGMVGGGRVDWYGLVELQIHLGAMAGDGGYLGARAAEVQAAHYEVPQKIGLLERQLAAAIREAREELAVVEEQLRSTNAAIVIFQHSEADRAAHAIAMLSLDMIELNADDIYLRTLVDTLVSVVGGHT